MNGARQLGLDDFWHENILLNYVWCDSNLLLNSEIDLKIAEWILSFCKFSKVQNKRWIKFKFLLNFNRTCHPKISILRIICTEQKSRVYFLYRLRLFTTFSPCEMMWTLPQMMIFISFCLLLVPKTNSWCLLILFSSSPPVAFRLFHDSLNISLQTFTFPSASLAFLSMTFFFLFPVEKKLFCIYIFDFEILDI